MTLKNNTVQLSSIWLPPLSYRGINKIRKDNKHLSVGKMVVNNQSQVVVLNRKFISMWNLTECVVIAQCERQVSWFIANQLKNPKSFLSDIENIKEQRTLETQRIVKLKDGRSFLHIMKPQWLEETVVGRVYRFQAYL